MIVGSSAAALTGLQFVVIALVALAYAALLVAAGTIAAHSTISLFVIGAVALLLLFVGIHNAWDTVTYLAVSRLHEPPETPEAGAPPGR